MAQPIGAKDVQPPLLNLVTKKMLLIYETFISIEGAEGSNYANPTTLSNCFISYH